MSSNPNAIQKSAGNTAFSDGLESVKASVSPVEMHAACLRCSKLLGFDHFSFVARRTVSPANTRVYVLNGLPDGWTERYHGAKLIHQDPILMLADGMTEPQYWDGTVRTELVDRVPEYAEVASEFGITCGVTAATFGPLGESALLTLCRASRVKFRDAGERVDHAMKVQWLCAAMMHRVMSLYKDEAGQDSTKLSPRERDCLRWAGEGKTSNEIGEMLGIAETTVNHHLKHATARLGTNKRQAALVTATVRGLLDMTWAESIARYLDDQEVDHAQAQADNSRAA